MYTASGKLNREPMKLVLEEVQKAVALLDPKGGNAARRKITAVIANVDGYDGPELYDALKQLSFVVRRASSAEGMQVLSAIILQMARVHNYQLGLSRYDDAARTIGQQIATSNPSIDARSLASMSNSIAFGIQGSAKIGAQIANVDAATVSLGFKAGVSRSGMIVNDLDTDPLFITLGQADAHLSLEAAIGKILDNSLGSMSGSMGGNVTRGRMAEGEKVQEVINHKVMHDREGGSLLSRAMAPSRRTLEARANLSTRGVAGVAAALKRSVVGRLTDGQFTDADRVLNTHKLVKGAITDGYLCGDRSLLTRIPECVELRRKLESAYAEQPKRGVPLSLKPVVGTADWIDVSGGVKGDMGLLNGSVADYVKLTGLGVAGQATYNHRWLPYQLWMAPHAALETLADRKPDAKRALLQRISHADPSVTSYLDSTRSLSLENSIACLHEHVSLFEWHAMSLLTAQGILRGYARTPRDLAPSEVLYNHGFERFSESLDKLKTLFHLSDDECKGISPDSDKLEGLLARCWNRLSLSFAQASLYPPAITNEEQQAALEQQIQALDQRIKRPNVLMAPEHLYHAATLQMEKTFKRSRVVTNASLDLPTITVGKEGNQVGLSLGTISGQVTYDRVTKHPNFVRNGDFLTFDMTARHPLNVDAANAIPRAIVTTIAGHLQRGGDKHEMNKLDQAALLASLTEAYVTVGTDAASEGISGTKSVQRQFEICAHRSANDEPWRLMYFQACNVKNSGIGVSGNGGVVLGVGGSVGASATYGRSNILVMPPILGSAPSVHILQSPRFAQGVLTFAKDEGWQIDPDKLQFDKLHDSDVASMYFSNDCVLDMLDLLQKLKVDRNAEADVLGGLARLGHNSEQFAAFQKGGLDAEILRGYIDEARKKTHDLRMAGRLAYFTDTDQGKQLLREYAFGIMRFAEMKSRAFMPYRGTDGRAMRPKILTASREKQPIEAEFSRNSTFRRGMRRDPRQS
jgi:hypothetical protein